MPSGVVQLDLNVFGEKIALRCPKENQPLLEQAARDINQALVNLQARQPSASAKRLSLMLALQFAFEKNEQAQGVLQTEHTLLNLKEQLKTLSAELQHAATPPAKVSPSAEPTANHAAHAAAHADENNHDTPATLAASS